MSGIKRLGMLLIQPANLQGGCLSCQAMPRGGIAQKIGPKQGPDEIRFSVRSSRTRGCRWTFSARLRAESSEAARSALLFLPPRCRNHWSPAVTPALSAGPAGLPAPDRGAGATEPCSPRMAARREGVASLGQPCSLGSGHLEQVRASSPKDRRQQAARGSGRRAMPLHGGPGPAARPACPP